MEDPIKPWFETLRGMGEFTGIRYGVLSDEEVESGLEPLWLYRDHQLFDGIGGFVDVLRERGVCYESVDIPLNARAESVTWWPFIRGLPSLLFSRRKRLTFKSPFLSSDRPKGVSLDLDEAPEAVAWHVFTEDETREVIVFSKCMGVTVNTLLLHLLDQTARDYLECPSAITGWMLPVNLRGAVSLSEETMNHSSCVNVKLHEKSDFKGTHEAIMDAIGRGQHIQNWMGYISGRWLSDRRRRRLISQDKAMSQWNLGCFSNLGVWDSEKRFDTGDAWCFVPPVIECQRVAAGCMTFQNRLCLTIQFHPLMSSDSELARIWLSEWVTRITGGV